MKRIKKKRAPTSLTQWIQNQNGVNCTFDNWETALKNEVKESLLDEQGYLCCYTGKRIDMDSSHIEHLKPQSLSEQNRQQGIADEDDIDYRNLLAAYPKKLVERNKITGEKREIKCQFGAQARNNDELPITPLQENCERRFLFDEFGNIDPANNNDIDAETTITLLNLRHKDLIDGRKAVFDGILWNDDLTEAKVRETAENAMDEDGENRYKQYCFVLKKACELRLKILDKERKIRKYAGKPKRRK